MAYKPAYLDPKVNRNLTGTASWEFSEVCPWIRKFKGKSEEEANAEKLEAILMGASANTGHSASQKSGNDSAGSLLILDQTPADKGANKNQTNWVSYWNNSYDNRLFASVKDFYNITQQKNSFADTTLTGIRKELENHIILTSSRIRFATKSQHAKIITYFGSQKIKPLEYMIKIPEYNKKELKNVLKENEGISFLQALFGTADGSLLIEMTLEKLSRYPNGNICIWTPDMQERKHLSERAVGLLYHQDKCHIMCCFSPNSDMGHSYGVRRSR